MADTQKEFELLYHDSVHATAEYLFEIAMDKAIFEHFEPEIFLSDVIRKMSTLFKKEG